MGLSKPLYDVTSSGMTHSFERILEVGEKNCYRVKDYLSGEKNFGLFEIDWSEGTPKIRAEVRGLKNEIIFGSDL